jgi:sugar phosphate isomerase/epimerase
MSAENPIFVSTACLPNREPLAARLATYAALGLPAIELGAGVSVTDADLDAVATSSGPYLVHNYFPPPVNPFVLNLASADETIRARSVTLVRRALALSARLGASFYSVHAGFITDPESFDGTSFIFPQPNGPDSATKAFIRFCETLGKLLPIASASGIDLLVENNVCPPHLVGKLLLQRAEEFHALFATVPHPRLGMLLDIGHMRVSATTFSFSPRDFITETAPYTRALHLHDNDGRSDQHQPLTSKSDIFPLIAVTPLRTATKIVEARFSTPTALKEYVTWLNGSELGG